MHVRAIIRTTVELFLVGIMAIQSAQTVYANTERSQVPRTRHRKRSIEQKLLEQLGLKEDATDSEIIALLHGPRNRITAISLVRRRRISSATPTLLEMVKDEDAIAFVRFAAARALCDFGNKEWIPTIKGLAQDPNSPLSRPNYRIHVARYLGRAGDYSQFGLVERYLRHEKRSLRRYSILALGDFRHKSDPVTGRAVALLMEAAISDPDHRLREWAIWSLDKVAKVRPQVKTKIVEASQANIDSPERALRLTCQAMLHRYAPKPKQPEPAGED